jgi:hypothetical protein
MNDFPWFRIARLISWNSRNIVCLMRFFLVAFVIIQFHDAAMATAIANWIASFISNQIMFFGEAGTFKTNALEFLFDLTK